MIDQDLIEKYGGALHVFKKQEIIFSVNREARKYFQIEKGQVKMNNYTEDGKEFIQSIFSDEMSFGEPPLFGDFKYPANAIALEDSEIWVLNKNDFQQLLLDHPQVHLKFTETLANRLLYKAVMAVEISSEAAQHRILTLLDYFKTHHSNIEEAFDYEVKLTRQQIGDLSGLRVETVIRTLKELEKEGKIEIRQRKVWI